MRFSEICSPQLSHSLLCIAHQLVALRFEDLLVLGYITLFQRFAPSMARVQPNSNPFQRVPWVLLRTLPGAVIHLLGSPGLGGTLPRSKPLQLLCCLDRPLRVGIILLYSLEDGSCRFVKFGSELEQ